MRMTMAALMVLSLALGAGCRYPQQSGPQVSPLAIGDAGCRSLLPAYPNATTAGWPAGSVPRNSAVYSCELSVSTKESASSVYDYYKGQMAARTWKVERQDSVGGVLVSTSRTNVRERVQVIVQQTANGTRAIVSVGLDCASLSYGQIVTCESSAPSPSGDTWRPCGLPAIPVGMGSTSGGGSYCLGGFTTSGSASAVYRRYVSALSVSPWEVTATSAESGIIYFDQHSDANTSGWMVVQDFGGVTYIELETGTSCPCGPPTT
jgi:hypothetical protein